MAKRWLILLFSGLAALLLAAFVGYLTTREATPEQQAEQRKAQSLNFVDLRHVRTARALLLLAITADEQQLASQAVRIADDEVDSSFAAAILSAQEFPPPLSPKAKEISARIQSVEARIQSDREQVRRLEALLEQGKNDGPGDIQTRSEIAKGQLELDENELEDAQQDLDRAGGNPVARIQEMQKEHEASEHGSNNSLPPQIKPASFHVSGATLLSHLEDWWKLHSKENKLFDARAQVDSALASLAARRNAVEQQVSILESQGLQRDAKLPKDLANPAQIAKATETKLRKQKFLATYDTRYLDLQNLSATYGLWLNVTLSQKKNVLHSILGTGLLIVVVLLGVAGSSVIIDKMYRVREAENRRLIITRIAYRSAIQVFGAVFVLLVLFGVPNQLSTVLALAGAGLTVVLKDFILGFFGWFTLMGSDGIRVGDWVEINSINGTVLEVGPLRTVLLETGNWNAPGHPTGRKVTLTNSFAIEGHYFNFTTNGLWLWDEINVAIPSGKDPYVLTEAILKIAEKETTGYSASADREWQKILKEPSQQTVSTAPAVEIHPTASGISLILRYTTQANHRHELRSRLCKAIVAVLREKDSGQQLQTRRLGDQVS